MEIRILAALAVGLLLEVFILWVSGPHLSRIIGNICCGALITALCLCLRGRRPGGLQPEGFLQQYPCSKRDSKDLNFASIL